MRLDALASHKQTIHEKSVCEASCQTENHECDKCGELLININNLAVHKQTFHERSMKEMESQTELHDCDKCEQNKKAAQYMEVLEREHCLLKEE